MKRVGSKAFGRLKCLFGRHEVRAGDERRCYRCGQVLFDGE